jgi:hypothetical protein
LWAKIAPFVVFALKAVRSLFDEIPASAIEMLEGFADNPLSDFKELAQNAQQRPASSSCQLDVLLHDGDSFGVHCTQIRIFKQVHETSFDCLLQCQKS